MLKKFISGIIFGSGFSIAFLMCAYIGLVHVVLPNAESTTYNTGSIVKSASSSKVKPYKKMETPIRDLTIDEKIEHATVIAIAEYQPEKDGKQAAIITDILKQDKGVEFFYSIGDEYISSSYYPIENRDRGDGVIIFFHGNPASMRHSTTYRGNRITGLSDIPITLFKKKCQK